MLEVRLCTEQDLPALAELNALLDEAVEGECAHTRAELEVTLGRALKEQGHQAFFFTRAGAVVGHALCDLRRREVYIRQFFIRAEDRRQGAGQEAFAALRQHLGTDKISLDVHCGNRAARAFWHKLGFAEKHVHMIFKPQ